MIFCILYNFIHHLYQNISEYAVILIILIIKYRCFHWGVVYPPLSILCLKINTKNMRKNKIMLSLTAKMTRMSFSSQEGSASVHSRMLNINKNINWSIKTIEQVLDLTKGSICRNKLNRPRRKLIILRKNANFWSS